jgi:rhodanese-related sulfurtransferase
MDRYSTDQGQVRPIGREEVAALVEAGAVLVDVMPADEFAESHLPGAVNIPLAELAAAAPRRLSLDRPVVVYCYDSL